MNIKAYVNKQILKINSEKMDVFWLDTRYINNIKSPALEYLTSTELQKYKGITHKGIAKQYCMSRFLLRYVLSLYLDSLPQKIKVNKTPKGKPYVNDNTVFFNMTHTQDVIAMVVRKAGPVGIDIEYELRKRRSTAVAKRYFSQAEQVLLNEQPNHKKMNQFYKIWTVKEAVGKCLGEGISKTFKYSCSQSLWPKQCIDLTTKLNLDQKIWYRWLDIYPDYICCVAIGNKVENSL